MAAPETLSFLELQRFRAALAFTLRWEGGFTNDPRDRGGPTNRGITQRVYDAFRTTARLPLQSVRLLTDEECRTIYRTRYWTPAGCGLLPPRIALAHFDTAVHLGVHQAALLLQRLVEVIPDGRIGMVTALAVQERNGWILVRRYLRARRRFYLGLVARRPSQLVFLLGWIRRLRALRAELRAFPALATAPPPTHGIA